MLSNEWEPYDCPIWGTPAEMRPRTGDHLVVRSPRAGGEFRISSTAEVMLRKKQDRIKVRLTTYILDENRLGGQPSIHSADVDNANVWPDLTFRERSDRLLQYFDIQADRIGQRLRFGGANDDELQNRIQELLVWTASVDNKEVYFLIEQLRKQGLLEQRPEGDYQVQLTAKGYDRLVEISKTAVSSSQAFVAMWFSDQVKEAYDAGIAPAIEESGYKPMRLDRHEFTDRVDDKIISEIRRSRFLVADFTSEPCKPRGGVYFEAGFAYGLNIPVIWTCREDLIKDVHFDTRQFNHISWSDPEDLREKLRNRIGAVIGDGPVKPTR